MYDQCRTICVQSHGQFQHWSPRESWPCHFPSLGTHFCTTCLCDVIHMFDTGSSAPHQLLYHACSYTLCELAVLAKYMSQGFLPVQLSESPQFLFRFRLCSYIQFFLLILPSVYLGKVDGEPFAATFAEESHDICYEWHLHPYFTKKVKEGRKKVDCTSVLRQVLELI